MMNQKLLISRWALPVALATIIHLPGCSESVDESVVKDDVEKIVASSGSAEKKALAKTPAQNKGVVKSSEMAGGYSYIEVDISGDIFWLATAISDVKPGDRIAWNDYAMMTNFRSKTLNREFSQILFVDRVMTESSLASRSHSGIVIESMNSAGYSYIHVEENGTRIWLAAPETKIEVGQSIRWNSGAPMRNFTSQSLNREFNEIFFVSAVQKS
jgi:hypothetical protein